MVEQKDIPIEREWIGTLDGMVNAVIKAQAPIGLVLLVVNILILYACVFRF